MTKRDFAAIGVRLMALLALFMSVQALGSTFSNLALSSTLSTYNGGAANPRSVWDILFQNGVGGLIAILGPSFTLLCLVILLWAFANVLAYFMAGREVHNDAPLKVGLTAADLLALLLSGVGIYFVLMGASQMTLALGVLFNNVLFNSTTQRTTFNAVGNTYFPALLIATAYCVMGILLVWGARPLALRLPAVRQSTLRGDAAMAPQTTERISSEPELSASSEHPPQGAQIP